MAAADKGKRPRASRPASLVQVYTAGLRWETEPMVMAWPPLQDDVSNTALHRLPLACPLEEPPGDHHTLWTALWQAACLLRPEVSPVQWSPRVRRLARLASALLHDEGTDIAAPGQHEDAQATVRRQLDDRMAEWVRRLLPSSRMPTAGLFHREISVLESEELDLDAMEACRRDCGVTLVAWRRRHVSAPMARPKTSNGPPEQDHWHWRVVAGLEGLEGPGVRGGSVKLEERFQPRSVLLLPQEVEAVWGCGYGMRLDPVAPSDKTSLGFSGAWQLRSLYGGWAAVEVVRMLMLRANRTQPG